MISMMRKPKCMKPEKVVSLLQKQEIIWRNQFYAMTMMFFASEAGECCQLDAKIWKSSASWKQTFRHFLFSINWTNPLKTHLWNYFDAHINICWALYCVQKHCISVNSDSLTLSFQVVDLFYKNFPGPGQETIWKVSMPFGYFSGFQESICLKLEPLKIFQIAWKLSRISWKWR